MEDIDRKIEAIKTDLEASNAFNVDTYTKKLADNSGDAERFNDLLFEGAVALMFIDYGFKVEMRESPDLFLDVNGHGIYVEVKHFRRKSQDKIDEKNLHRYGEKLVKFGDTIPTEGMSAWDQLFSVVRRKANQYVDDHPNILVISSSSSHCIDDSIIPTVINMIDESIDEHGLDRLNGIMLLSRDYNVTRKRSSYFFATKSPKTDIDTSILNILKNIRKFNYVWGI